MQYAKESALARLDSASLAKFLALATAASLVPFFINVQWISGPIVNAILIIALFWLGLRTALLLCVIPSLMALAGGLLPILLAPAVPFIMMSNAMLVLVMDQVYNNIRESHKAYFFALGAAAMVKFLFLYLGVTAISNLLIKQELAMKVAQMMSWPQFATALSGGLLAWIFLRWLKRL